MKTTSRPFGKPFAASTLTALALAVCGLNAMAQSSGTGSAPGGTGPGPGAPAPGQASPPPRIDPAARGTGNSSVTTPGTGTPAAGSSGMSGSTSGSTDSSGSMRGTGDGSYGSRSVGTAGTSDYGRDAYSIIPGTRRGYIGLNIGKPEFDLACGSGNYGCNDPDAGVHLYTGGLFNDWLGVELGYVNTGRAERAGGRTRAQGVNLSLVGRLPVGPFNAFVKGGAIYGESRVSTGFLSDQPGGKARGWGASYGAGVGFDFTPRSGVVLEWSRNEFRFPGAGKQDVDMTSLGYVHRF